MAKKKTRPVGAWPYVLLADRALPEQERTTFTLRPLTAGERESVRDRLSRAGTNGVEGGMYTEARRLCLTHIESIENFPAGAPSPWPKEPEKRAAYLEDLDDDDVFEVGNEIWIRSSLGPEEVKVVGEDSPLAPTSA